MEQFIENLIQWSKDFWAWLLKTITQFAKSTEKANIDADFGVAFFLALLIMFLLGSACWAASIASCRKYNPIPHFFAGLILPWIYPLFILFTLDIKGNKEMKAAMEKERVEREAAEAERQKNIALNRGDDPDAPVEQEEESKWNQKYFEKIARKDDGSPAGPWDVVYSGHPVRVMRIIEALPEVVHIEFLDTKGTPVKMRIPYAKIETWENTTTEN